VVEVEVGVVVVVEVVVGVVVVVVVVVGVGVEFVVGVGVVVVVEGWVILHKESLPWLALNKSTTNLSS
jgi:hypothetical protein